MGVGEFREGEHRCRRVVWSIEGVRGFQFGTHHSQDPFVQTDTRRGEGWKRSLTAGRIVSTKQSPGVEPLWRGPFGEATDRGKDKPMGNFGLEVGSFGGFEPQLFSSFGFTPLQNPRRRAFKANAMALPWLSKGFGTPPA